MFEYGYFHADPHPKPPDRTASTSSLIVAASSAALAASSSSLLRSSASGDEFSLLRCDEALEGAPAPKAAQKQKRKRAANAGALGAVAGIRGSLDELITASEERV